MSKEKQIESTDWLTRGMTKEEVEREKQQAIMSVDLEMCHTEFVTGVGDIYTDYDETARKMFEKGYRKQSEGENISQMHPSDEFICEKCGLIIRECCRYEIDEDDGDEICYEFPYRFCPRCGMKVKGGAE